MRRSATILLLSLLCLTGCEEIRRNGRPGDHGYIAPDFRSVMIVHVEPGWVKEIGGKTIKQNAYTIVEDDRKRRFIILGVVGKLDESFKMDVSLENPVN